MFLREKEMKKATPEQNPQPSAIEILKRKNSLMDLEDLLSRIDTASAEPWKARDREFAEFYRLHPEKLAEYLKQHPELQQKVLSD
jgi:hypothetical protein